MNDFNKRQLIISAFLAALYLRPQTREHFKREWMRSDDEMDALELKSVPSVILNMVIANEIRKQIGEPENVREFFFDGFLYLLAAPPRYADTGVIMPIRDASLKNVKSLQLFRHAKDTRPFFISSNFIKTADSVI